MSESYVVLIETGKIMIDNKEHMRKLNKVIDRGKLWQFLSLCVSHYFTLEDTDKTAQEALIKTLTLNEHLRKDMQDIREAIELLATSGYQNQTNIQTLSSKVETLSSDTGTGFEIDDFSNFNMDAEEFDGDFGESSEVFGNMTLEDIKAVNRSMTGGE